MAKSDADAIREFLRVNNRLKGNTDVMEDIQKRIDLLKSTLREAGLSSLVLGISGGIDSTVAGVLCQKAVDQLRSEGYQAHFYAMRLPYGHQRDEQDAQQAIDVIKPDFIVTVDIQPSVDAMTGMFEGFSAPDKTTDMAKGNIKARARMIAQYTQANLVNGVVVGTSNASEMVTGFFTKHGDGACDVAPLSNLTKGQVKRIASDLMVPMNLVLKEPVADLGEIIPDETDEDSLGMRYSEIDAFLLSEIINNDVEDKIISRFHMIKHKLTGPKTI